ncbi:MAG TPA: nucleotide exchange factor GrpE [Candidatus Polarisedimenticolia bacterium]|nr:nucleotide exchange factor GrpE [Candidatus Polarisedimenticolia bacterium]
MASHVDRRREKAKEQDASEESLAPEPSVASSPESGDPPAEPSVQAGDTAADSLAEQIRKLQAEKQELMDTLVRRQADFENYRKRIEKERHHDRHRGVELLIEHLLPVLDAFDRALSGPSDSAYAEYRKGFELIRRQLWETLAKQGLVRVEALGQEFNPHFHHAIERVETTEHVDGIVIGELQPGYLFHDRVLRPAMVRVAVAPEPKSAPALKHDN